MMTKQAELKQQAYASNLKSRALSILIYLIDRSNKDLTCFPAIPTMANQLHISVSTVKRALHELVDAGYIQKGSRFRDNNRGQTSNLYTIIIKSETATPEHDDNLTHEDNIEPDSHNKATPSNQKAIEHITFATLKKEKQKQPNCPKSVDEPTKAIPSATQMALNTPIHFAQILRMPIRHLRIQAKENAGQFIPCNAPYIQWTGAESNLIPP